MFSCVFWHNCVHLNCKAAILSINYFVLFCDVMLTAKYSADRAYRIAKRTNFDCGITTARISIYMYILYSLRFNISMQLN